MPYYGHLQSILEKLAMGSSLTLYGSTAMLLLFVISNFGLEPIGKSKNYISLLMESFMLWSLNSFFEPIYGEVWI